MNFIRNNILCLVLGLALSNSLRGAEPYRNLCLSNTSELSTLPLLHGGRIRPLKVQAQETLKVLTGKKSWQGQDAVTVFCLLSLGQLSSAWHPTLTATIEHQQVQIFLQAQDKEVKYSKLLEQKELLRSEYFQQKFKDSYKKELERLLSKIQIYEEVLGGQQWTVPSPTSLGLLPPPSQAEKFFWIPISQYLSQDEQVSLPMKLLQAKSQYQQQNGDHYLLELTYTQLAPFQWGIVVVLGAIAALTLFSRPLYGHLLASLALLVQAAGIVMRILISGRAPITNMYETVMFSGFGALVLAVLISFLRKEKFILLGGLTYNLLTLMMLNFAHGMLNPHISPLVPVLRDNFWLSTHVTTIILSYAALALSWVLSNIVMIKNRFSPLSPKDMKYYTSLIYTCLKFGIVLLSSGVILGGVWADYSWGRFWGWDPKETWSLIVLLIYVIILHGKYTSWIPPRRFIPLTALAFLSVMMAWFGVNYILASGLHSYGFSEGGAIFLGSFFLIQIAIFVFTSLSNKKTLSSSF